MNRKKFERRTTHRHQVTSLCMAPLAGSVTDLSTTGLGLETWDPLPVRADFALTIGQVKRQARLPCRVMWCHLIRTETTESGAVIPIYRSGVRFLELEERKRPIAVT